MLQSMRLQRVRHNLVTEQQQFVCQAPNASTLTPAIQGHDHSHFVTKGRRHGRERPRAPSGVPREPEAARTGTTRLAHSAPWARLPQWGWAAAPSRFWAGAGEAGPGQPR